MQGETVQRRCKTKRVVGDLGTSLNARGGVLAPRTEAANQSGTKLISVSTHDQYSVTLSANFFDNFDY